MENIASGDVVGPALKAVSDQYNTLIEKVEQLKEALAELEAPKHYRIYQIRHKSVSDEK